MVKRHIDKVILHCLDTPDFPLEAVERDYGVDDVRAWHLKRGWDDVGYHFVIKRGGTIELGRALDTVGAHCKGENGSSIGIAYAGRKSPTEEQLRSIIYLYREFYKEYGLEAKDWRGHNEFTTKKKCPGFPMDLLRVMLEAYSVA